MGRRRDLFDEGTPVGRLMAATDWAATPVGEPETWPETLRVLVRTAQSSRYPMLILWGDQFTQIYNDAYSGLIGDRHPAAMGGDCRVTLSEGWPVLGPLIAEAMETGVASWVPALQLLLERAGYREEAYFSVSHAPAEDDEGVTRGVLTVCSEVTEQVVGERRLRLLQAVTLADDTTVPVDEVATRVLAAIEEQPLDVPFVGLYLRSGDRLRRVAASIEGLPADLPADLPGDLPADADGAADDPWGIAAAARGAATSVAVPAGTRVLGGAFGEPVTEAVAIPIPSADPRTPLGVLVSGVSPSRALDDLYRSFLGLLAQQVGTALRNALAYEEERARAEALAELDRVKTEFFTNVSHEFRTPLTLMLGPLGDALEDVDDPLSAVQRERVGTALRASRRLLKLVNNLLTFSSLEAGAASTDPEVVDLAELTGDVASGFRAAVERGGLSLDVTCAELPPTVLDPVHWETIVTNLLSNALKFTFAGGIAVRLDAGEATGEAAGEVTGEEVRLVVADTGVGIPAEDLPRLFDRFHRARGARSRSHEGSGIGLALVGELVALHGGTVEVESTVGVGTTFTVRLPARPAPAAPTSPGSPVESSPVAGPRLTAAVEEAESWVPVVEPGAPARPGGVPTPTDGDRTRVLVADDNADMREHVTRLLEGEGWEVTAVPDGQAALERALHDVPDLLLTDVMMPRLDGFELVRALRADPRTATLPIVVLSARAGEGASAEGLDLGADDYVVKPFLSSDLLARLRTTLRLARQRTQHVAQLHELADAAALITSGRRLDDALGSLVEQVRVLLPADEVVLTLAADDGGPDVVYGAGASSPTADRLTATVRGRGERRLGTIEVRLPAAAALQPQRRAMLEPVTRVLAAVIEEGWHAERDVAVASTLQQALLPDRLPDVPGLRLAAAYRPAERSVQVGGDWYDVLALPDGRVALCIGDVAGQGLTSALVMGQLRTAVRAYALEGLSPTESVAALDELMDRMPGASFTTMFLGHLDVVSGVLTWCNAGHPPPVVLAPDGRAEVLGGEVTPPLGAAFGLAPAEGRTQVPDGASLVAYTDGLVEDRETQLDGGPERLVELLRHRAGSEVGQLVDDVLGLLAGRERTDDVAVLVLQRAPGAAPRPVLVPLELELDLPLAAEASGRARREVRPRLLAAGLDERDVFEVLVSLTEAVNNAVEHAVAPTRDRVLVRVAVDDVERRVRVEVQDFGRWRERGPSMDRGHGAALMSAAGEVRVVPGESGTTVVLERVV
ncbi:SpoIIE family protein phosphatase [Nocardioides sp. SOB77]|uniref:histidine kinase n=1 Tax=Nocardioides oceani TaxID=3058369 RepID=A0ABT8FHP8_9ACTN|nr:SpoIIE family protein phosphatase [Nocardioides oceani]MDN4174214.1 SpoIIE family protein phosphatase [Nocardioides oceani]